MAYPAPAPMMPPGAAPIRRPRCPSATITIVLGWIVPGLGQLYVGRPGKAAWFFLWVVGTYALGLYLTGFAGVHRDRESLWLIAQAICGGPTAAALWWTREVVPLARLVTYDVGLLYTGVAGLLNAIVLSDALGTVEDGARAAASFDRIEAARAAHAAALLRTAEAEAAERDALRMAPEAVTSALEGAFGGLDEPAPAQRPTEGASPVHPLEGQPPPPPRFPDEDPPPPASESRTEEAR